MVSVGVDDVDDLANHIGFTRHAFRHFVQGNASGEVRVQPHLDNTLLVHTDHVFVDLKVPHSIIQLRKSPKGLVVDMQDVWVRDVLNFTESVADML